VLSDGFPAFQLSLSWAPAFFFSFPLYCISRL